MNINRARVTIKQHSLNEKFKQGMEVTVDRLARAGKVRVSTKMAKAVLIEHDTMLYNGVLYTTNVRNVGAGVKELYLKECRG